MQLRPVVITALLLVSAGVTGMPVAATGSASTEAGTHVSFEASNNAVVDYTVDGRTVVRNLTVKADSDGGSQTGVGAGVSARAGLSATGLSLASSLSAGASAELTTDTGATITAHDNHRGVLVVESGGTNQTVDMNVSADARAESEGEKRVVVTTDEGQAAVLATGDGTVSVTANGSVRATTGADGEVVYRQYEGDRSESDESQEELITNGTAAAELYVQQASSNAEDRTTNVVNYGEDTTVEVTTQTATTVNATVDRSKSEGRAVVMSLSEAAFENADNAEVYVDGEAAVRVDSYSEISGATSGDESAYLVEGSTSAEATVDVVVGIDHFSSRDVSVQSENESDADGESMTTESMDDMTESIDDTTESMESTEAMDGETTAAEDEGGSSGSGPGFGVSAVLVALLGLALLAGRRQ